MNSVLHHLQFQGIWRHHFTRAVKVCAFALGLAAGADPGRAGAQVLTNHLVNPGFELGLSNWTGYVQAYVESTNNTYNNHPNDHVLVHGGTNIFKTFGGFQSYTTYSGCYQDLPAAADSTWALDCWALSHADDFIAGQNRCWLEVSFRNNATPNTPLATYISQVIDANVTPTTWTHLVVTDGSGGTNVTAPYGTSFARCQVVFQQIGGTYSGGSVYVDDVNLLKTSAPDPEITVQPVSQTRFVSQSVTFTVTASGRSALTYRWQRDGFDLLDGGKISGVATNSLTISNLAAFDQAGYAVVVSDNAGPLTSDTAYLTILDPGITSVPASQTRVPATPFRRHAGCVSTFWYRAMPPSSEKTPS